MVNKHLLKDLVNLGLWNDGLKNDLIAANGSIQSLDVIPQNIKDLYKTVWEIKQKDLIDMAADRGAYICQSQSLNLFVQNPNFGKLTSMHFYAWKKGLKTTYYLRSLGATTAEKSTINSRDLNSVTPLSPVKAEAARESFTPKFEARQDAPATDVKFCSIDNPECEACQ